MKPEHVLARILLSSVFVAMGGYRLWMAYRGLAVPNGTLLLSAAELVLGLAIAGAWRLRLMVGVAVAVLLVDAVASHPFWTSAGTARGANLLHFAKNLGLVGGLLLLAGIGGGKRR
jgi:putative oxidoreductase